MLMSGKIPFNIMVDYTVDGYTMKCPDLWTVMLILVVETNLADLMKKQIIAALIFLVLSIRLSGQLPLDKKNYIRNLLMELQLGKTNADKADKSYLIAEYYLYSDTVKAKEYLQKGLEYSDGDVFRKTVYDFYRARLASLSNADEALKQFMAAEQSFQKIPTKDALLMRSKCWHDYALLLQRNDNTVKYTDILLNKSIPLAMESGDSIYLGKNYLDVALGFKNAGEHAQTETYLNKSIDVLEGSNKGAAYLVSAYHTLGEIYTLGGKPDAAVTLLAKMKTILIPYPESPAWIDYYSGESMRLTVSRKYDQSLNLIAKGMALADSLGLEYQKQRLVLQKFYALYEKGDFKGARTVGHGLVQNDAFMMLVGNRMQIYQGLAAVSEQLKDYFNAYEWSKKYTSLSDSLYKAETSAKINALEIKYETNEKEKTISQLQAEKLKSAYTLKTARLNNLVWAGGCALLLIAAGVLVYILRNNRKLSVQKEINYRQQLKELDQQQQLALREAMLQAGESERQRLARDLHDGLGGMLSGIKLKLSGAIQAGKTDQNVLQAINGLLGDSVTELRRIAYNMMPENLIRFGLETALEDLCSSLNQQATRLHFESAGLNIVMDPARQIIIYRIIQEALTNALKHAEARNIWLQCRQEQGRFIVCIEDDGRGFDMNNLSPDTGIGLQNIRNRVQYLKGTLDITSKAGAGTTIIVALL